MSDKELKLKGDQNFEDLRDVWERLEELEEWKEAIVKVINFYTDKEIIHKEVLQDYMEYMKNFNPQSWVEVNKLLKKLKNK